MAIIDLYPHFFIFLKQFFKKKRTKKGSVAYNIVKGLKVMLREDILQAIGNTPLIKIKKFTTSSDAQIWAKAEFLNVGGCVKIRSAYQMICCAIKQKQLKKGGEIIEATSGNQGVALALIGAVKGFKVTVVMPDSVSNERRKIIEQYGGKVVLVKDETGKENCFEKCVETAKNLAKDRGAFFANQFENYQNALAHKQKTAKEIVEDLGEKIDGFCVGVGSGGTISGIAKALKKKNPKIIVWAVEPKNSAILSGGKVGSHLQMGIGDGIIPPVLDLSLVDNVVQISDENAIAYSQKLAKTNGLLCGISSGSNIAGSVMLAKKLGKGKRVVTILPDGAERYFSTALFD